MKFCKYHGAGNDFVMIDNRKNTFPKQQKVIATLCNRHFGIGADGLILLENDTATDFRMVYYNADGNESTMCGNGGRCVVQFAHDLKIIKSNTTFIAIDGIHSAEIIGNQVKLQMIDVEKITTQNQNYILNTGSPHYVQWVKNLSDFPVVANAKKIRYNATFAQEGINVNFAEIIDENTVFVRTYERGVEDETLACGTGVTAVAISIAHKKNIPDGTTHIQTLGGNLSVSWHKQGAIYTHIFLQGEAKFVFKGKIKL